MIKEEENKIGSTKNVNVSVKECWLPVAGPFVRSPAG
jgi:hypothetical protein